MIVAVCVPAEVGLWLTVTRLQVSPEASAVFGMHAFELGEENLNWLVEPDVVYVVEPSRIGPLFALSVTVPQDLVSPMPVLPHESEETIAVPEHALVSVTVRLSASCVPHEKPLVGVHNCEVPGFEPLQ